MHARLRRLDWIVLIMDRRCRAGEVPDFIHFDEKREAHIVPHEFKARLIPQVCDIVLGAGLEDVDARHIEALV